MPPGVVVTASRWGGRILRHAAWGSMVAVPVVFVVLLWAPGAARHLVTARPVSRCDLMVILGGGALERIWSGVELHADGACGRVLLTGELPGEDLPRARAILERLHAPDRVEPGRISSSTLDDALLAYEIAHRDGFGHLLVITSPYHTRRVAWVFSRVFEGTGIEFGVLPSQALYMDYGSWWRGSYGRRVVPLEYAKLGIYGLAAECLSLVATWAAFG